MDEPEDFDIIEISSPTDPMENGDDDVNELVKEVDDQKSIPEEEDSASDLLDNVEFDNERKILMNNNTHLEEEDDDDLPEDPINTHCIEIPAIKIDNEQHSNESEEFHEEGFTVDEPVSPFKSEISKSEPQQVVESTLAEPNSDFTFAGENSVASGESERETDQEILEPEHEPLNIKPLLSSAFKSSASTATSTSRKKRQAMPQISYRMSDDEDDMPVFSWQKEPPKPVAKPKPKPRLQAPKKPMTAVAVSVPQRQSTARQKASNGPSMFVTEIQDGEAVKKFEEKEKQNQKQHPLAAEEPVVETKQEKPKVSKPPAVKTKPRMTHAMMQFSGVSPNVPVTKQIDLSKYDDDDFNWDELSKNVPPRIVAMLVHSEKSIVARAICGVSLAKYTQNVVSRVLLELKKYLNTCMEKGLIGESSYMQCIIDGIKDERKVAAQSKSLTVERVNERLTEAEEKYEKRKSDWENQKAMLEVEKDLSLEDLELRYQEETMRLDEEWNSEHMQAKFNKPSPMLIELRHNARSLMNAHRFEEAAVLADEIAKREQIETEEAAVRMRQAYQQANDRLRQQFEADRQVMIDSFEVKKNGIIRAEEANLRPLSQRIEKYQKMKTDAANSAKRNKRPATSAKKTVMVSTKHAPISIDAKLKLPPLGQLRK